MDAAPALLRRVLAAEKPEYLEVVALVAADRLHFRTAAQCATAERMRERFGRTGRIVNWGGTHGYPGPGEAPPVCGQSIVSLAAGARNEGKPPHCGQSAVPAGLTAVTIIAAGATHSLALTGGRKVVAWGNRRAGQLAVPFFGADVLVLAAGANHSLALIAASGEAEAR